MIQSIRIRNLRSLRDTGIIKIKPLTILLGANSSGKSTFLRSFPLLTQSVKKNLRGPISWFDDSLVDFGDYNTAKSRFVGKKDSIKFSYHLTAPFRFDSGVRFISDGVMYLGNSKFGEADITISFANDSKGTFVRSIRLVLDNLKVYVYKKERNESLKFKLNQEEIALHNVWSWNNNTAANILPSFVSESEDGSSIRDFYQVSVNSLASDLLAKCDKRLKTPNRLVPDIIRWKNDKQEYLNYLQAHGGTASLRRLALSWTVESQEYLDLFNNIAVVNAVAMIPVLDKEISDFYSRCSYIAPTRAEANRFYRTQGLQVSDIDPYGKNLEEFLSSLTNTQMQNYNDFIKSLLDINIRTTSSAGHHSIELVTVNGNYNMADVGFGYSQLLPIITKLWYISYRSKNRVKNRRGFSLRETSNLLTAIEQPELHLHPAYQAKVADAFLQILEQTNPEEEPFRLLVETHSQTMINRIGRRIREGRLSAKDVNVILFEKKLGQQSTEISQVSFDKNGQLKNWPYNFFDPED